MNTSTINLTKEEVTELMIEKDHVLAWGYILYDRALEKNELDDYELTEAREEKKS